MLYLPVTETVRYHYDFNGNCTATVLPDGRQINYLYYGSGHLHQISLDDEVISDIERDKLHREIYRTQGKLASRYELDPLGRLKRQIAAINELTQTETAKNAVTSVYAVNRSYAYDKAGNLTHRELADGEVQNYFYDLHDQLVMAEIFKKDGTKETWTYTYDALGRRIGKRRLKNEEVSDGLEEEIGFVWDGSHLLQEVHPDGRYTYLYTDPDSYEPLAQVHNRTNMVINTL
ncbi:RHS repeat domain-containing protein [Veillonella sp. S13053-19]|uniref:RHS repeat domain-containing protein n=1 Tax=Veillonella sp. S13053-19 TaxID=2027456 RepID=UPI0018EADA15|nr:hypothetical protein [Veillonella sp. S13053-19]